MNVQIYGAGSSGCHMAKACLTEGHKVSVYDIDPNAERRFIDLFKSRYGVEPDVAFGETKADLTIISTPPHTHLPIYQEIHSKTIVEKPLCLPKEAKLFNGGGCFLGCSVNYNHLYAPEYLKLLELDPPQEIEVRWQESITYILNAHPWLRFEDSYLSDCKKGGGSAFEHSHGLAAALGFFPDLKREEITRLKSEKRMNGKYDEYMKIRFVCRGILVTVITDFISTPSRKEVLLRYPDKTVRSDLGIPNTSREDQFLLGLRGALKENNSLNIGKLCVEIIGECLSL